MRILGIQSPSKSIKPPKSKRAEREGGQPILPEGYFIKISFENHIYGMEKAIEIFERRKSNYRIALKKARS